MITNYGQLAGAIAKWLIDTGLENQVSQFVALAEGNLKLDFRVRTTKIADINIGPSGEVQLPVDFKEVVGWSLNSAARPLVPTKAATLPLGDGASTGTPENYVVSRGRDSRTGAEEPIARVYPKPSGTLASTLTYRATLTSLDSNSDDSTNWLLSLSPAIYLYAALEQSAPYLRDDARLPMWIAMKEDALNKLWAFETNSEELHASEVIKLAVAGQGATRVNINNADQLIRS